MALTTTEITEYINEDRCSRKKQIANVGLRYYEADHDILQYKAYSYNADGILEEDKSKSNIKIAHPFFTELVDQATQYLLSDTEEIVNTKFPELQTKLNAYFNEEFIAELADVLTYGSAEGSAYMYRYTDEDGKSCFMFADGVGIVEVPAKFAKDTKDHIIYYYVERIEKDKTITAIQDWDDIGATYYTMVENTIAKDDRYKINPRPHITYKPDEDGTVEYDTFGEIPFYRFDNNRKQFSDLKPVKALIDDYDLMNCSLSNNLEDLTEGVVLVKGFSGNSMDELMTNVKTKKVVGVGDNGDLDIKTVDIPYDARKVKMEIDEKNIYRFGMGLNSAQVGDGNITNIVIKSRYALLDLKCNKKEKQLKKFLKNIVKVVLDEINKANDWGYTIDDITFAFERSIITNESDNVNIEKIEAETKKIEIDNILNIATKIDNETVVKAICDVMDIDYEEIKDKLPNNQIDLNAASEALVNSPVTDKNIEGGGTK